MNRDRTRSILAALAAVHLLGLVSFFTLPFAFDRPRNLYSELFDVEFWVFPAVFAATWGLISMLVILRRASFDQPGDVRSLRVLAIGICAVLIAFAFGAVELVPESLLLFRAFGADLPGPTLLLVGIYEWWPLIPALGFAAAGVMFATAGNGARAGRFASGILIGLLVVANTSFFGTLFALFLPFFKLCGPQELSTGFTRLHAAATLGRVDAVRRLLAQGAIVNARELGGATPLHLAVSGSHLVVAEALLAKGADANAQTAGGRTPLHAAANGGHVGVATLLLARGAHVNALDDQGRTPLDLAYESKHAQVAELLAGRGGVRSTKESRLRAAERAGMQARRQEPLGSCGV